MGRFKAYSDMHGAMYALGRMSQWKSGHMHGGSYLTAKQIGNYKVEYFNDPSELQLTIWNPDRPCIVIVFLKELETAVLNIVKYDKRCTVDGKMEQGKGTRDMISFALKLIKEQGAKRVELDDRSTVPCNNGTTVKLGPMYFFKFGHTWYEKYFGFQPIRNKDIYAKAKEIQKTLGLERMPCEYFTDDVLDDLMEKVKFAKFNDYGWEKTL